MPMVWIGAGAVALLTFFLTFLLIVYARDIKRRSWFDRLEKYDLSVRREDSAAGQESAGEKLRRLLARAAAPLAGYASMQAWDTKMRRAGIPLLGSEFLAALFFVALLVGAGVWMLLMDPLPAALAGIAAVVLLQFAVSFKIGRRRQVFTEQLGDALASIANALRAGYSFQQAMEAVGREMEPPISEELSQVSREVSMGVPLETALESMNQRMESSDFDLVATAVVIQREVGGNLAQILDTISETIGDRIRMKREIRALTAQGRFSALILFFLPFAIGIFMYTMNPGPMVLLFQEPIGRMAVAGSILWEIIGVIIIQRIVNVKI